jgi:hypothetical protein
MEPARITVMAQLSVRRGRAAVEFYRTGFGAVEVFQVGAPMTPKRWSHS